MLLDDELAVKSTKPAQRLEQEIKRLRKIAFISWVILVGLFIMTSVIDEISTKAQFEIFVKLFIVELLFVPFLSIVLSVFLNIIPYREYAFDERLPRMFWIIVITLQVLLILFFGDFLVFAFNENFSYTYF